MINPSKLAASSAMDGFKNYLSSSFSATVSGQTIASGHFVSITTSTPLNNANSVSQLQVQYSGTGNSEWFIVNGSIITNYSSPNYQIESYYYFDSTNLNLFTVIVNESAGSITIPTIKINCRGFLFLAPF